ncbi:MAG TPA: hypothetical protein VMV10_02895 [Pirellulales bacterium]|nr:hypothetical protein [Pirellulales bacterium]
MMLAWLALALLAIGVKPHQAPLSEATAARPAKSAHAAAPRKARPVSTGSLAWLANDPRCAAGAELVLQINSEADGLSQLAGSLADQRRRKPTASWLLPLWLANASSQSLSDYSQPVGRDSAALPDDRLPSAGARLGWSGCTAYCEGSEEIDRLIAAAEGRESSPTRWLSAALAGMVRDTSASLAPWLDYLASHAEGSEKPAVRVSRRPGRADVIRPQEQAIPQAELVPPSKRIL